MADWWIFIFNIFILSFRYRFNFDSFKWYEFVFPHAKYCIINSSQIGYCMPITLIRERVYQPITNLGIESRFVHIRKDLSWHMAHLAIHTIKLWSFFCRHRRRTVYFHHRAWGMRRTEGIKSCKTENVASFSHWIVCLSGI